MADHQDRALVIHEKILQPHDAGQIQVVGRLVQQYHIRVAEEGLGQQHLDLDARVGIPHEAAVQTHVHPQALQDAPGVALGLPAAQLRKLLLQFRRADAVFITEVRLLVDGVLLLAALVKAGISHDDGIQHRELVIQALVLLEHRHAALGIQDHTAACGLQLAGEDLDKCGFAGAVGADDAVAVARGELQVDARKQHARPELHGQIVDSQHSDTP